MLKDKDMVLYNTFHSVSLPVEVTVINVELLLVVLYLLGPMLHIRLEPFILVSGWGWGKALV